MAEFLYRAIGSDGSEVRGVLTSPNLEYAAEKLSVEGLTPLSLTEKKSRAWEVLNTELALGKDISRDDVVSFMRGIARLLGAGISLERALVILKDGEDKKALGKLIETLQDDVRRGLSFSAALTNHNHVFPPYILHTVEAGEAGGTLDTTIANLANMLERSHKFERELKSALIYPVILLALISLTFLVVMFIVLPQFQTIFADAGAELPALTKAVLGVGRIFEAGFLYFILAGVVGGIWLVRYWQTAEGSKNIHKRLLKVRVMGKIIAKANAARFSRTLGALLEGGVSLDRAFGHASGVVTNIYMRQALEECTSKIRKGGQFSRVLASVPFLPSILVQMAKVGDETGRLGPMLSESARILEDENEAHLKKFLAIFVPAMTLVLGAVVALMIGSVLLGILQINELPL